MDKMEQSEARAEYRNVRQGAQGKGDSDSRTTQAEKDNAAIWCNCIRKRFKDKCEVCR